VRFINITKLEELEDWPPGKLEKHAKEELEGSRNKRKKRTPAEWRERWQKAENELRNLPEGKTRSQIFAQYSDLWSDVKEHFRTLSHDKCWYCETSTHRMPGEIDHYRPKAGVAQSEHPGYWWLAFEWRNWRFVCKHCNSQYTDPETGIVGGKGNHFPLLDGEKRRICSEHDYEEYEDLLDEDPMLLDPTERGDPELLTFTSDGRPAPAVEDKETINYQRVKKSIEIYHLNHSRLNRERRKIYNYIRDFVKDYQRYQLKWEMEGDRSARALARKALIKLGDMITPDAEYSSTARAYLRAYSQDGDQWAWVDRLLTAS